MVTGLKISWMLTGLKPCGRDKIYRKLYDVIDRPPPNFRGNLGNHHCHD